MNAMPLFSVFAFILMIVLLPFLYGEVLAVSLGDWRRRHWRCRNFRRIVSRVFSPPIWPDLPQRPTTATSRP